MPQRQLRKVNGDCVEFYAKTLSQDSNLTKAPDYIRVLPLGNVSSEKGNFVVDGESYRLMKEHMQRRAIDIVIDYEHQTLGNVQAPAGGWIKELILKKDGIYARVEWTNKAKNYLRCKEYRYLSPVVIIQKNSHRVSQLHSVALTNTPAINGMTPIVNSATISSGVTYTLNDTEKEICKMLNLKESDYADYCMRRGKSG